MSKNAPDTRNKLDNNRKAKTKKVAKKRTLEELLGTFKEKDQKKKVSKRLSAEDFKKVHGYSRSVLRNMKKLGIINQYSQEVTDYSITQYRASRKARKDAEKKLQQKKHSDAKLHRMAFGKRGKGKTQAPKKKADKSSK